MGLPVRQLSENERDRLRMAGYLMGDARHNKEFCAHAILDLIKALPPAERQKLREQVDWVQDYERHE